MGLVSEDGSVEYFYKASSREICDNGEAVELLADKIELYIQEHGMQGQISAIGIGFPSPIDAARKVVYNCPNLQNSTGGFDGRNVVHSLQQRLGIPTFINKDACNLLWYEIEMHKWKGSGITIGFYYGTGIGNSVYLGNGFLDGKHGVACDVGHIPFYLSDRYCTCGNRGCAECYAQRQSAAGYLAGALAGGGIYRYLPKSQRQQGDSGVPGGYGHSHGHRDQYL